jgi:hypothetical protein
MRIHTDSLTSTDIAAAANFAGRAGHGRVYLDAITSHGSRKRRQAWEVKLTGDGTVSRRRTNGGTRYADHGSERDYAATWDSWGWFIAFLFSIDPAAVVGPYDGVETFHRLTGHKFHEAVASAVAAL